MINQNKLSSVVFDDNGAQTGISFYMASYGRDSYVLPMVATEDYLYYGRYKPFDALFVEMKVSNSVNNSLGLEYWNGTAFVSVVNKLDDTDGLKRSGFIQWDKPTDWATTTVNGEELYWIRVRPSADLSLTTEVQGINVLFSDDQDLNGVYPGIISYLNNTETTFVLRHENSRNLIVQDIRNRGFTKRPVGLGGNQMLDEWDFLRINECKQWSVYLTLSNIFSSLQSNDSDMYKEKAEEYQAKADFYKAAFYLTLDRNDNGKADAVETAGNIHTRRLVRG